MSKLKTQMSKVPSEHYLIEGILSGDESVLREFYTNYALKLTNFIRQKVSNEKDVEEITQDVLLATVEGLRDFTYRSMLYTYMCGIAKRKVVDYYRKQKLKRIVFSQVPAIEPFIAIFTTPEDKLDEKILAYKIRQTFETISPSHRRILHLKYVKDYSVEKIAHKLSISFKSAESMLFRARKAFALAYSNQ